MAKRGQRKKPSEQTREWREARAGEVKVAKAASAGDPAARDIVRGEVAEIALTQARKRWQGHNLAEAQSELCWRFLEWLEACHRDRETKVERTGWQQLADFRGESTLATFLAGQMRYIAQQYATALGAAPKTEAIPGDDRLPDGGDDIDLEGDEGGIGIVDGEPDDGPLAPTMGCGSLSWSQAEIDRVRKIEANPVRRLAFYLLFVAHRMPPVEEIFAAADHLHIIWPEVVEARIAKLTEVVCERVFCRNVALESKRDILGEKVGRLEELQRRKAEGRHLRKLEEEALVNLPETIAGIQRDVRMLGNEVVHPTFDEIALVLAPAVGKPRNRGTIHGWVKPICETLAPEGPDGEDSPCALLFSRGRDKGSGTKKTGRKKRSGQQPPRSARPSRRSSS